MDVFNHVTIRLAVVDFLWVVHCDYAFILHHYEDMKSQMLDGRTDGQTDANVILDSLQCYCIALDRQWMLFLMPTIILQQKLLQGLSGAS